jgi:hypothetical protein
MKTLKFIFCISTIFIFTACAPYPTTHTYFEPSSTIGNTYDSTPCGHLSEEHDQIKIEHNKTTFAISARYQKNQQLVVVVLIEPRGNDIQFNPDNFKITDNTSGAEYVPINKIVKSRTDRISTSVFESEEVYRHWITLTYDVMSDTLSDFQLVFSDEAIEMNSTLIKIQPIHFIRIERVTVGLASINC